MIDESPSACMSDHLPYLCRSGRSRRVLLATEGEVVRAWSWPEMTEAAQRVASRLLERSFLPGDVAVFSGPVHPAAWFAAWGVWLAGGRVAWVEEPEDAPAACALLEARVHFGPDGEDPADCLAGELPDAGQEEELARREAGTTPEETALILFPRGHRGQSGDAFSHGGLVRAARAFSRLAFVTPSDRILVGTTPDHPVTWGVMLAFAVSEASLVLPPRQPGGRTPAEDLATVWVAPACLLDRRVARIHERIRGRGRLSHAMSRWALAQGVAATERQDRALPTTAGDARMLGLARRWLLDDLRAHLGPVLRLAVAVGDRPRVLTRRYCRAVGVALLEGLACRRVAGLLACGRPHVPGEEGVGAALDGLRLEVTDSGELLLAGQAAIRGRVRDSEGTAALRFAGWVRAGVRAELEGQHVLRVLPEGPSEDPVWPGRDWESLLADVLGLTAAVRLPGIGMVLEAPGWVPVAPWWAEGAEVLRTGRPHPGVGRVLLDLLGDPEADDEGLSWHLVEGLPRTSLGALDREALRRAWGRKDGPR
jgi:hypothetical protein